MKLPCPRCGRVIATTRHGYGRHAHRCPHGVDCYPQWGTSCAECRELWTEYRKLAGDAEFAESQRRIVKHKAENRTDGLAPVSDSDEGKEK